MMRILTTIAICLVLSVTCRIAAAEENAPPTDASSSARSAPAEAHELHFASVLKFHGEVTAVDREKSLVTLKGAHGEVLTYEAEKKAGWSAPQVGERLVIRYVEGGRISRENPDGGEADSLKDGMLATTRKSGQGGAVAVTLKRVDLENQEVSVQSADGSLETIIVSNPDDLNNLKVGDQVTISHPEAVALSVEKAS